MTPGTRQLVLVDRSELYKGKPVKALTEGLNKTGGRNNFGNITSWQRGGGHKRRYRLIDFKRRKFDVPAKVERLEYDPNRTAFIALITYADGEQAYILAPQRIAVGDTVISAERASCPPLPTLNSMLWMIVPIGMLAIGIALPGFTSACSAAIALSPTPRRCGARM